jgi:hypothetical protein
MTKPGRFSASVFATANTCSSGAPVTSATLSGVHFSMTSFFTWSMP